MDSSVLCGWNSTTPWGKLSNKGEKVIFFFKVTIYLVEMTVIVAKDTRFPPPSLPSLPPLTHL